MAMSGAIKWEEVLQNSCVTMTMIFIQESKGLETQLEWELGVEFMISAMIDQDAEKKGGAKLHVYV